MGFLSTVKNFFCDLFGIETKEEKEANAKSAPKPEQAPTSKKDKEAKEHTWKDADEPSKYVCQGGKAECMFCSPSMADIVVTSTDIMLQDKPWATVGDCDGKKNLIFTGVCKHPSQQKPGSPPPPCKTVISLGKWKNFSETIIGDQNALVVKSTIPCMISGQDIKITDSGQRTTLSEVEPRMERKPDIISMMWVDSKGKKIKDVDLESGEAFLRVKTRDYKDEKIQVKLKYENDEMFSTGEKFIIMEGEADSEGIAILAPIYDNIKFNKKI